ncbi:hypothetical protein MHYP_G00048930 [Metynnis hypsauchen]
MGRSQELSELQRGTVIGRHLCSKSSREISSLLNIPTVNCQWDYNKVEVIGNDSNSATKWSATISIESFMEWVSMARAAASKPCITKRNAKRGMQWCKAPPLDSRAVETCSLD